MPLIPLLLAASSDWPVTKAEATGYRETSSSAEVAQFVRELGRRGAPIRTEKIGETHEGRAILLTLVSDPPIRTPEQARAQGKLVVYIQANIHAGEVEGKESTLSLLRRIAQEHSQGGSPWLKRMVLLVNPNYNADGNDKWAPTTQIRPDQDGPEMVGTRANGQGLDLNRDAIKAASPEMQAALRSVYTKWDPDVVFDLHTTNGTRHGWDLTYAPPTSPNTPPSILSYSRDSLIPAIRAHVKKEHGMDTFDYGNAAERGGRTVWETFGHEARYVTNYAGLRGQIGILVEATSYIPFKDRVAATDRFMEGALDVLSRESEAIRRLRARIQPPREFTVEVQLAQGRTEDILLEDLAPGEPRPRVGRPKKIKRVPGPVFDRFKSIRTVKPPRAYLLPKSEARAIALLQLHGVPMRQLDKPWSGKVEAFTIKERIQGAQPFQGVRLLRLKGTYSAGVRTVEAGAWWIPATGPLGALASHLLEPEGDDGLGTWGFLADPLTGEHSVLRVLP